MSVLYRFLLAALGTTAVPIAIAGAPPAAAECTNANGVTVCAQGEVRGADGGSGPGFSGPVVPYPCEYDWYCDSDWDLDIGIDPGPPPGGGIDIGRPGRPGIGPR
ncbi:hypothetical protein FR943_00860 [Mycobacterium sp. TNTM28]|uniref:Uncharacterized protein n=1 Tax=[Mycobacterium] fortunisiensis TaxID=2600579 RepID=A0ABS6KFS9_9MYCO|nr:hypothetical protein [[Mycobacterium] fortunisiensis]MBU9762407.1 hypothetical protein [[Mycobacterium] fortunisiensis]